MSISAPRIRLISRALDGISEEDITLALSTRSLNTSYKGPCVQVRRDPPENSLVFVSKVDGLYNDRLDGVAVSATGELYVVGRQRDSTFYDAQGTSVIVGPNSGYLVPCIVKYASNGSPVWLARINGSPGSNTPRLCIGEDGNVFLHVYVNASGTSTTSLSVYDSSGVATLLPWSTTKTTGSPLVKYTSNGDVAWAASVRSEGYNVIARDVASDEAAGAYVCGSCSGGAVDTVSNVILYDSAGAAGATLDATGVLASSGWLGRYNSTGNVLWATSILASECIFSGVVSDGSGGVLACGDIYVAPGTTANVLHSNGAVFSTLTSLQRTPLIVKYDAAGTALAAWVPTASTSSSTMSRIASDGTGNVYIGGSITSGRNVYNSDNALAGQIVAPTGRAVFVIKFDSDLNAVWWTSVDGAQTETPTSVAADANGVYLTGTYATTAGGTANIYHANTAVAGVLPATTSGGGFCVSYSPSGTVQSWNSTSSGSIEGVALDPVRNRAMVVGYSPSGTTANLINQSGTVLSSITGTGEAGFLGGFQLGSTVKDIGFKGGSLDTLALKQHCPVSSNGYVQTWYSQSPALSSPSIEEYPPAPMTADTTTLSGQAYGNGTYVANASSVHNSTLTPWKAFDRLSESNNNFPSFWHSGLRYAAGAAIDTTAIVDGVGVPGEWLEIRLPNPVSLRGYGIMPRAEFVTSRSPVDFTIAGSNDGLVWTLVDAKTSQKGYLANTIKKFTVSPSSTTTFIFFRLIVSKIPNGGNSVQIGEWRLYATSTPSLDARQFVEESQPLLVENGVIKGTTNRPLIDFSGGKSLVAPYDASAAGTPMYTANTSGLGQSTYATTISSGEVIGVRSDTPTITENQQFAYGTTPNTLSSARATIGTTPVLDTLSQNAQTSCLAAFSFRRVLKNYTGPVVRLRRESDNAERDFYGSPSAIELWIGSSSARVVTFWDQSSNEKHATQLTPANQPLVAKQYGVYVAHFNGTFAVPQYMTFADIYPASFWANFYLTALNNSYGTVFAQAGANFGFRPQAMTANSNDFLGTNVDVSPYWIRQGTYGNNFVPNTRNLSVSVWNRVTASRMTSAGPINQLGRGLTTDFRDLTGFLGELIFFSKPALVSDALLLDASPLVKTTSMVVPGQIAVPTTKYYVQPKFATSILEVGQYMASSFTTPSVRTSSQLVLDGEALNGFDYVVKRGNFIVSPGYNPLDWFSSVKDTRSAWIVVDGNLTISEGVVFTPPVRKLFTVLYVKGNLVLDGEISMTARGANHNGTGESGFSSVFPGKNIKIFSGDFGDLFGATNAFVPAGGGSGGPGATFSTNGSITIQGANGTSGGSAGGGGGAIGGSGTSGGSAGAGTSFGGGTGGGATYVGIQGENGELNGGVGGINGSVGGSGAGNGPNGTGGTLFVIVSGTVSGAGKLTSHGSSGTGGWSQGTGGGSGGGSAWLLCGSGGDTIKVTATGGPRVLPRSGLGGNGSAMKISLRTPQISSSTRSSVVGAYSLRRLISSWGGPVARIRHGTTNEQRDFYAEDLLVGAALDTFLGGAVAYIQIWYDQSGSNNHASQTTTTSQPTLVRDASWTTKPTVRCGGTGFLNYNGAALVNTNYTVAVSTARTSNASYNYFIGGTTSSTNQNLHLGYRTDTQVTHDQYANNYNMTVAGYVAPIPETFVVRHSSTLGKNTYRNGTFLGSNTSLAPLAAFAGSALGRFTWTSIGTVYYQGDISEVVLCASYIPDPERSILEASMMLALGISASGGTVTTSGAYTIHTFTTSGTFTLTSNPANRSFEVLVVAGGGGGGGYWVGGGGGAGGLVYASAMSVPVASYNVVVGAGGGGGNGAALGSNGGNSSFNGIEGIGGGGGGFYSANRNGINGGCGGGASYTGTAGLGSQGFNGGGGTQLTGFNRGSGGGGMGSIGKLEPLSTGGDGLAYSTSGTSVYYSGGGGGGSDGLGADGGLGGGGKGGNGNQGGNTASSGASGANGQGGGGGGAGGNSTALVGGSGGSGIVIIRYLN